jgi:hypothetical protein
MILFLQGAVRFCRFVRSNLQIAGQGAITSACNGLQTDWNETLLCLGLCAPVSAQVLDRYLPKSGVIAGQVMELAASAKLARVSERGQRAAQRDAAWFKSYVAKGAIESIVAQSAIITGDCQSSRKPSMVS